MTIDHILSIIEHGQQHGTTRGATQQSHPPSLYCLPISVLYHQAGRCASPQTQGYISLTTTPAQHLGMTQECLRRWMRMLHNISVTIEGRQYISARSLRCVLMKESAS